MNQKLIVPLALQAGISALLGWLFVPAAFAAGTISIVFFGVLAAACVLGTRSIERATWKGIGIERAQSMGTLMGVRLAIYLVLPTLIIYLVGSLAPHLLFLVLGLRTAFLLTFIPLLMPASYIGLVPVKD